MMQPEIAELVAPALLRSCKVIPGGGPKSWVHFRASLVVQAAPDLFHCSWARRMVGNVSPKLGRPPRNGPGRRQRGPAIRPRRGRVDKAEFDEGTRPGMIAARKRGWPNMSCPPADPTITPTWSMIPGQKTALSQR